VAAAPPGVVRPRLVVADTGSEVLLEKDEVLIGRRSPVDGIFPEVDLTDVDTESYVSRRHGRIVRQDSQFFYEDLGSSNGSFHNGTRLQRGVQASLQDGDRLRLGKTELVFRVY
jgi:pSer/pThr/pTyr-binding forkhead associated (FHA) protein